jgi:DNA modification methylase
VNKKAISDRNDVIIKEFIEDFSINQKPIEVSFRRLLPEIKNIDRYTHLIHSYPAKLLVHIPYFFLNNSYFSNQGDNVLDPFNGSGTVLLESVLSNRNSFGADSNPLARLIAEVKVSTKLNTRKLSLEANKIDTKARNLKNATVPDVVNCNYWFSENTILQLSKLLAAINKTKDDSIRKFMLVAFSNCVRKVSYADQRVSVPVRLKPSIYGKVKREKNNTIEKLKRLENIDVFDKFSVIVAENIKRFKELEKARISKYNAKIISIDARVLTSGINKRTLLKDKSIQLVITSPPYAGAQKYIRASSLNLGWTELAKVEELFYLDRKCIGRENYRKSEIDITETGIKAADELIKSVYKINPIRATIICNYLIEMKEALNEIIRVLKEGGFIVLIVGNNKVCNREFNTQEYFTEYLVNQGLKLQFKLIDDIKSYGLMTKRNKTADIISREWILVFKKQF